jgi:integrase/recombinase XerD
MFVYLSILVSTISLNNILDIDKEFLLSFLNKDENISSSTKILRLRVMKSFFSFIDEIEGLNSLFEIRFKKLSIKAKVKEVEALNSDEVKRLLALFEKKTNSFNKNRDALLIKLIIFTGIRASECLNLQLSDFFVIDVDGVSVYKILIYGKGNKERYVYIKVDKIQKELEFLTVNNYIVNYIAVTSSKKKMTRVGLYNMISNKMKKALIKKKGVHILRHTFARDLVAKNINLQTISELLGHASIILTAKTYARSNEGSKIRAII